MTALTKHELRTPFSYLVACDYCSAAPGWRCTGADSHPDGYPSTIHSAREEAFWDLVAEVLAGPATTATQVGEVYARFKNPAGQEIRRAVANVLLVPEQRH